MANTRELRRRIKSVKNTAQITRAMQMVAATKMRRAQSQALNGRPYSGSLSEALLRLLPVVEIGSHPLLLGKDTKSSGMILLTSDKSLCGALNTNLFRLILASHIGSGNIVFYTVGKKGRNFVVRTGHKLVADFENPDTVVFRQAVQLSKLVMEAFLAGEVGEVYIVFPRFGSTLRQEPTKVKLLPMDLESVIAGTSASLSVNSAKPASTRVERGEQSSSENTPPTQVASSPSTTLRIPRNDNKSGFLFEPDPTRLLDYILVHHLQIKIYQALLETKASEHSARMIAMQNATDNALELVDDLSLTYNQTRQDSITKELLEITTAVLAMS